MTRSRAREGFSEGRREQIFFSGAWGNWQRRRYADLHTNMPGLTVSVPALTTEGLMARGFFPDRSIPSVNSVAIAPALPEIDAFLGPTEAALLAKKRVKFRSRCSVHSVSKRKHLRRLLSVPNPLHQYLLAKEIATHWSELHDFCASSPLALSVPIVTTEMAVSGKEELSEQPFRRAERSIGSRYLLKTDLARFYPSVYTHSIPWALHGKDAARKDSTHKLLGNRLDLWMRETQDKQTGGIPIGPDTSFVVGEVIGTP